MHILQAQASARRVHRIDIIVQISVIFHADFVIRSRNNRVLKIQKTARIIHFVIAITDKFNSVQPHALRIRNNRNKSATIIEMIPFTLPLNARKRTGITRDLIRSPRPRDLGTIPTKRCHRTKRRATKRRKRHRIVIPREVSQMEHRVRRFHPKINLVNLLKRCCCLVARLAVYIRQ